MEDGVCLEVNWRCRSPAIGPRLSFWLLSVRRTRAARVHRPSIWLLNEGGTSDFPRSGLIGSPSSFLLLGPRGRERVWTLFTSAFLSSFMGQLVWIAAHNSRTRPLSLFLWNRGPITHKIWA